MNISINEQNQKHIQRKIESGAYNSPDEVIAKALELLDERDEELARELEDLRAKVQEGIDDLKAGRYTTYTRETLHELFDRVKRRGRERKATRNVKPTD